MTCQGHTAGPSQSPTLSWKRKLFPTVKSPRRPRSSGSNEAEQPSAVEGKPAHLSEFPPGLPTPLAWGHRRSWHTPPTPLQEGNMLWSGLFPSTSSLENPASGGREFSKSAWLHGLSAPRSAACPLTVTAEAPGPASLSPPSLPAAPIRGL